MSSGLLGSAISSIHLGYAQAARAVADAQSPEAALSPEVALGLALAKANVNVGVQVARVAQELDQAMLDILA